MSQDRTHQPRRPNRGYTLRRPCFPPRSRFLETPVAACACNGPDCPRYQCRPFWRGRPRPLFSESEWWRRRDSFRSNCTPRSGACCERSPTAGWTELRTRYPRAEAVRRKDGTGPPPWVSWNRESRGGSWLRPTCSSRRPRTPWGRGRTPVLPRRCPRRRGGLSRIDFCHRHPPWVGTMRGCSIPAAGRCHGRWQPVDDRPPAEPPRRPWFRLGPSWPCRTSDTASHGGSNNTGGAFGSQAEMTGRLSVRTNQDLAVHSGRQMSLKRASLEKVRLWTRTLYIQRATGGLMPFQLRGESTRPTHSW